MTNVVSLSGKPVPTKPEVNPDVIVGLKGLLALAEAGQISCFRIVGLTSDYAEMTATYGVKSADELKDLYTLMSLECAAMAQTLLDIRSVKSVKPKEDAEPSEPEPN